MMHRGCDYPYRPFCGCWTAISNVGTGALLVLLAGCARRAGLGYYLLRVGRRINSMILEADGRHVLTDCWTSFGVLAGLGLVRADRLEALRLLVGHGRCGEHPVVHVWCGDRPRGCLIYFRSGRGAEDSKTNSGTICAELSVQYHGVRFRTTGYRQIVEVHLLFPQQTSVGEAHRLATILEERLPLDLGMPAEVLTHLESLEDHEAVHDELHRQTGVTAPAPPAFPQHCGTFLHASVNPIQNACSGAWRTKAIAIC